MIQDIYIIDNDDNLKNMQIIFLKIIKIIDLKKFLQNK